MREWWRIPREACTPNSSPIINIAGRRDAANLRSVEFARIRVIRDPKALWLWGRIERLLIALLAVRRQTTPHVTCSEVLMRIRAVVASVLLLPVPAIAAAQRIPIPVIGRRAPRPADLPPQPGAVAREIEYRRWRLSTETYPLVSYVQAPGLSGVRALSSWATFGVGQRADYLLTRNFSATLDFTSSFLGGPAITNTAELGTRVHPEWAEHKLYPFLDLRLAYITTYDRGLTGYDDPFAYNLNAPNGYAVRYATGFGVVAGGGLEYALTQRWSLTSALAVLDTRLAPRDFTTAGAVPSGIEMTSVRFTAGVRYNPIRIIRSGTDIR